MKMKWKKLFTAALALCMAVLAAACGAGNSQEDQQIVNESPSVQEQDGGSTDTVTSGDAGENDMDDGNANDLTENEAENVTGTLPAYEYPGPELFYSVLYQYMVDDLAEVYSDGEVIIPCPVIITVDEDDTDDIKVYGDFWIFSYYLEGDILKSASGGSYPGCIHVKSTDDGYEITGMDGVGDGSQFTPTAKEIFGQYYDEFVKVSGDEAKRDEIRAQIIANYVAANGLDVSAYQDEGWDPVPLPEENIDSFYSDLD